MSDKLKRWFGVAGKRTALSMMTATMLCGLAGCDSNEISNSFSENSGDISQNIPSDKSEIPNSSEQVVTSANNGDGNAENGPFISEEAYNEICQNIIIGEKKISFPCTLGELKPEITTDDRPFIQDELRLASFVLFKDGKTIGACSIRYSDSIDISYSEDTEKFNDGILTGIDIDDIGIEENRSAGWITMKTTADMVLKRLGEPTQRVEFDDGDIAFNYFVDSVNGANIRLFFNNNQHIRSISLTQE